MAHLKRNGTSAWIGLPEREAAKLQELWHRDELGLQLSVEVHAPVVVGIYPMRIARYVVEGLRGDYALAPNGAAMHQRGEGQLHNGSGQRQNGAAPDQHGAVSLPAQPLIGATHESPLLHDDSRS
jgi:hypothetical protein